MMHRGYCKARTWKFSAQLVLVSSFLGLAFRSSATISLYIDNLQGSSVETFAFLKNVITIESGIEYVRHTRQLWDQFSERAPALQYTSPPNQELRCACTCCTGPRGIKHLGDVVAVSGVRVCVQGYLHRPHLSTRIHQLRKK